jgi:hypothetical protein
VGQVPVGEVGGERERADVTVLGGLGELQPHPVILAAALRSVS